MVDQSLTTTSRKLIFLCVWVHLIMATVFFANWPYDNANYKLSCAITGCSTKPFMTGEQKRVTRMFSIAVTIGTLICTYKISFVPINFFPLIIK
jgi:hypothetical protein